MSKVRGFGSGEGSGLEEERERPSRRERSAKHKKPTPYDPSELPRSPRVRALRKDPLQDLDDDWEADEDDDDFDPWRVDDEDETDDIDTDEEK